MRANIYFTVHLICAVSKLLGLSQDLFFLCKCWEMYLEKSDLVQVVGRWPAQPGDRDNFSLDVELLSKEVVSSSYIVLFSVTFRKVSDSDSIFCRTLLGYYAEG